ncbi:hypothetical protein [Sphingomonas sp. Leaf37]|uniref:hypothetical protein n=1 Tax=Sphingomonas sp. Leaf37 TaxID=2876552 RepID=UPI001E5A65C5|nr:hypothetical protein [Sphingomonas sp. Leaf37]
MAAPVTLESFVDGARSAVARATSFDAKHLIGNALAQLHNAHAYVVSAPAVDRAYNEVRVHVHGLKVELSSLPMGAPQNHPPVERARQLALLSIEHYAAALGDAQPNEMAKALGLDWF